MQKREKIFIKESEIAFDLKHRAILNYNISRFEESFDKGKLRYLKFNAARDYASEIKNDVTAHLDEYLTEFEKKIAARGATVLWALSNQDALKYIHNILDENSVKMVVKTKSMISEEIQLNEEIENSDIEAIETDLGEFIVQTAGEKPYHILTPAMHKSKEDVATLFHKKFGLESTATPTEIAGFVRTYLRKKFTAADAGVTGANFIIADAGSIGLTENEGNGLMTISFPRIHIVIAGIERVIPSVRQLPFFFQWLGVHGTGQYISAYNTMLLGPKSDNETDGPEKMYVILLDNRRSSLLSQKEESQALKCIRCGACLNVCPIYINIGGYVYSSTYTGPVGSVISPYYSSFREYGHLSHACSLCGRCSEVCPVKIPLHELLLLNRRSGTGKTDSFIRRNWMKAYAIAFKKRGRIDCISGNVKNRITKLFPSPLGPLKNMPRFTTHSFSQQWKIIKK